MITTHPEPDPAPFKVHLLTKAGRVMRARSEPVRAFFSRDEAVRFAGRQLGGHYAVYHKDRKFGPSRDEGGPRVMRNGGEALPDVTRNGICREGETCRRYA
jgi:hypothetical protein